MNMPKGLELIYYVRQLDYIETPLPQELTGIGLRRFIDAIIIDAFGFITKEQARFALILSGAIDFTPDSTRTLRNKDLKCSYFKKLEIRKNGIENSQEIYRLTNEGVDFLLNTVELLFEVLHMPFAVNGQKYELFRSCKDIRELNLSPHSIMVNTQSIIAVFRIPLYKEWAYDFQKECNIDHFARGVNLDMKVSNSIVSDFRLRFSPYMDSLAFEVDLDTERIGRLQEKVEQYDTLYNMSGIGPIFLFDTNGSIKVVGKREMPLTNREHELQNLMTTEIFTKKEITTLTCMIDSYLCFSDEVPSFREFYHFLEEKAMGDKEVVKTGWYRILDFAYRYLDAETVEEAEVLEPERGNIPLTALPALLTDLKKENLSATAVITSTSDSTFLGTKRQALFNRVCKYINDCVTSGKSCGILSGMPVVATIQEQFWRDLFFVFPLLHIADSDVVRFRNIGIAAAHETLKRTTPITMSISTLSVTFRQTVRFGNTQIIFENVSEDIGGLLRTVYYMNMSRNKYPHTLLIALVGNDLRLADGGSLCETNILNNQMASSNSGSIGKYIISLLEKQNSLGKGICQNIASGAGLVFMTYHDFDKSRYMPSVPFIPMRNGIRTVHVSCELTS